MMDQTRASIVCSDFGIGFGINVNTWSYTYLMQPRIRMGFSLIQNIWDNFMVDMGDGWGEIIGGVTGLVAVWAKTK
jgi:hypothetical protein